MTNNTTIDTMNSEDEIMMRNQFHNSHISCDSLNETTDYFGTGTTGILGTMLVLSIIAAVFGNLMVIIVILRNRAMREMLYMFFLSLAIADLMIGALMAPLAFYNLLKECWSLPRWMCTLNLTINTTLLVTSIHTLMWIAVYKCICVHSVTPPLRRYGNAMIVIAWVWGLLLAFCTTHVSQAVYKPKTMQCGPTYPINSYFLHAANQFINLVIPIIVMLVCYIKVYIKTRRSSEFRRQHTFSFESSQEQKGVRAVAKTLVIVLVCFLLCWLPYFCYSNIGAFINDKSNIPSYLNAVAYTFGYMNSACNPIIYAWRCPEFRRGYRDILCRCQEPEYTVTIGPLGRPVTTTRSRPVRSVSAGTTVSNTCDVGPTCARGSNGSVGNVNQL
ncbi:melatonin receptor type 1B-B-like isoform X2 [Argopecten irradians]|uniref:melatonin receptor type 1B-B-like isoform X2 n=1 Tax=Argopecten irradians TaxID=31199 RepID=UPI0037156A0D